MIVIEEWPAILASVNASQPVSARQVRAVWRRQYGSKGLTPDCRRARSCWLLAVGLVRVATETARDFAGRGGAFFLAVEDFRVRYAYQFNPLYPVNVSQVDPIVGCWAAWQRLDRSARFLLNSAQLARICHEGCAE